MNTIGKFGRVSLLLGSQELSLADGVDGGVRIFSVLRQGSYVDKVYRNFHELCQVGSQHKEPTIRAHRYWHGHVEDWGGFFGTFYAIRVVPIQAPSE